MESQTFLCARMESRLICRRNCLSCLSLSGGAIVKVSCGPIIFRVSCCVKAGKDNKRERTSNAIFMVCFKI